MGLLSSGTSGDTLQHLPVAKGGITRKLERDILQGPAVKGQGAMPELRVDIRRLN